MKNVILYARVSGREQGKSGLGIAHQMEEMKRFCAANGLTIVGEYREVISGKYYLDRRPVLKQAVDKAQRLSNRKDGDCYILTSRLDRLSRETGFICELLRQDIKFITAETGIDCGPMLLQIRASVAEEERRKAADRSKGACSVKRQRGIPMGMKIPAVRAHKERSLALCKESIVQEADSFAEFMKPTIVMLRQNGYSVNAIADYLNTHNFKTQRGGKWWAKSVANIMQRWGDVA
jgi:DNA invertase Pin-like site-specific DNA recombinase